MPNVLTMESNVTCAHQGKVQVGSTAKLKVNNQSVLLESSIAGMLISNCATQKTTDPTGKFLTLACANVSAIPRTTPAPNPPSPGSSSITNGRSQKLKVGGFPVMLETLAGQTDGMVGGASPVAGLKGVAVQNKLATTETEER